MTLTSEMRILCSLFCAAFSAYAANALPPPDGTEWEDPSRQSAGTLAPHASFASFPDVESARAIRPEASPRHLSLDSESAWRFHWCRRPSERPADFFRPSFDVSSWAIVKVPCSWQAMGIRASGERFEPPLYTDPPLTFAPHYPERKGPGPGKVLGHPMPADWTFGPADNPVGSYRRDFTVPDDWLDGDRLVLQLDGVESFHYVWVNGTYVGFSKSSRDAAEYDVTKLIRAGNNVLAIEVYRNSDGSWLETMDMWRLGGIFRSVSLRHTPATHVRDVSLTTRPTVAGAYDGDWAVQLAVDIEGDQSAAWNASLFDGDRAVAFVRTNDLLIVRRPRLWTAETPNLYTLVVELTADGRVREAVPLQLGFREVAITGTGRERVFRVNGSPVKLKGANRHECDPLYGHFTPDASIKRDLEILKRGNFNCIRTSHYPQSDFFYYLANKYGFYVIDEANLESHATTFGEASLSHDPAWRQAHLFRVRNLVERDKCHPCVVIWSLGNEAGGGENLRACYEWVRARDASRPIHYEGNNDHADMGSCMYPSVQKVQAIADGDTDVRQKEKPVKYPFFLVEYAHNLVHGVGNLDDFQAAIESSERVLGGAVWDFADQGLYARSNGVTFLAFSGDFGEKPIDPLDGANGYVLANRRPEPSFFSAAHAFRPYRTTLAKSGTALCVENRNFFLNASTCICRLTTFRDGHPVGEPEERIVDLPPREAAELSLPAAARGIVNETNALVSVRIEFATREANGLLPKGWIVARDQVDFGHRPASNLTSAEKPRLLQTAERLTLVCGASSVSFDRRSGLLVSLARDGRERLIRPVELDVFRAPMSGDTDRFTDVWMAEGLRDLQPELVSFSTPLTEGGITSFVIRQKFRGRRRERLVDYLSPAPRIEDLGPTGETNVFFSVETRYGVTGDGRLRISSRFRQHGPAVKVPRVGWRFVFAGGDETVSWFGLGPRENYPDAVNGAVLGRWTKPLKDFQFPYARNEDAGTHLRTYELALSKVGVRFESVDAPFAFSASPYSPTELIREPHAEFLPAPTKTEFGIYPKVRGLGSGNCGPLPLPRDLIPPAEPLAISFDLIL